MSTYYYFGCKKCKLLGGLYTRQAWGAGNADLVDTYKFCMQHAMECGNHNIRMFSEHDYPEDWGDTHLNYKDRKKFLEDTADIYPRSNDWGFSKKHSWPAVKSEWVTEELWSNEKYKSESEKSE